MQIGMFLKKSYLSIFFSKFTLLYTKTTAKEDENEGENKKKVRTVQ